MLSSTVPGFLIVDDEPLVARAMARALPPGEAVVIVHGLAAAERYIATATAWKAFIIDISLGPNDAAGFELLSTALNRHPDTPALLVTGHSNPAWHDRARSLGVPLIKKPFEEGALRAFATRVCGEKSAPPAISSGVRSDSPRRGRAVVADEDARLTGNLCRVLAREGFEVTPVTPDALRDEVSRLEPQTAVLTNLSLREAHDQRELVEVLRCERPDLRFIVGAYSFALVGAIMRADDADWADDSPEMTELRSRLVSAVGGGEAPMSEREHPEPSTSRILVESSRSMDHVFALADKIAQSARAPALLVGESGVGKEVIATRIHERSARRNGPFVRINLAAISDGMVEAELFGSVRGAFTDAKRDRTGLIASADRGTILLDEIGECRVEIQAKLLRVIENRTFFPVGSDREKSVDVRIVAATNRPPADVNNGGAFRTDLLFRLGTVITIPPLRERRDEIIPLAEQFAREVCAENERRNVWFTRPARSALEAHDWPGNVRELKHVIERAVMLADGSEIGADVLELRPRVPVAPISTRDNALADARASAERTEIAAALEAAGGSPTLAARKLGISRSTLYEKIKKHQLR